MRTFSSSFFHRSLRFPRKTIEPNLDERLFHLILIQKFNFLYFHQEKNNNSTLRITVPRWISRIPCLQPLSSRSIRDGKRRVNDPFDTAPNTKSFPRRNILIYRENLFIRKKKNAANSKHTRRTRAETRASHWFTLLRDTLNLCGEAAWLIDTRFLALCFERDSLLQGVVKQNQKNSTIKLIRSFKLFFCNLVWMRPEFKVVDF